MNKLNHVAIIMDGNGRWGLKKKRSRNYGHLHGLTAVENVIKSSINYGKNLRKENIFNILLKSF